jgi:uncharacterized protein YdeI (YjbR/CyaY-like superfamily)
MLPSFAEGDMKRVQVTTRSQWREWLVENHDLEKQGIWLVFKRKATGKPSLEYEESVEEALCFGWIDSVVKKIDEDTYCRKFTPRKDKSNWSTTNKKRINKIIEEGRMTPFGLAKVEAAKKMGNWNKEQSPIVNTDIHSELAEALAHNKKAKDGFDGLAPSCQKQFIRWIAAAKRPETRAKRLMESLAILSSGKKLGLK